MIEVRGKFGVYAKVLKHSISPAGVNLLTFEVSYPRIILAELNTHGMICKNSSSSRAIPFEKMKASLTGRPIRFGANQAGMQDKGEDFGGPVVLPDYLKPAFDAYLLEQAREAGYDKSPIDAEAYVHPETNEFALSAYGAWHFYKFLATSMSQGFYEAGYHKQVYNRLTEACQMMKTVLSATEWANFFWLRDHDAADPSLQELAHCMHEAAKLSTPEFLYPGEWHLPYVHSGRGLVHDNVQYPGLEYWIDPAEGTDKEYLTLDQAIKVSSARCAAVSFRNVDYGVDKSAEVFAKLTSDLRIHGSAFQHQGTPMKAAGEYRVEHNEPFQPETWEEGITHVDREGQLWSAQFRGWRMHRKLIAGENKPGFLLPDD